MSGMMFFAWYSTKRPGVFEFFCRQTFNVRFMRAGSSIGHTVAIPPSTARVLAGWRKTSIRSQRGGPPHPQPLSRVGARGTEISF